MKMVKKPEIIEQPKKVEKPVESPPQFKNVGEGIKIKLVEGKNFKWITVKKDQIVTIPRAIAIKNQLIEVK